jgi:hypothetical protein
MPRAFERLGRYAARVREQRRACPACSCRTGVENHASILLRYRKGRHPATSRDL